ncbi:MAG: GAF domain-containing protein [Desulfobacteraceae bacterium]|nr:GAF domain-containing protein [Desulfobacteraceae bacterium]
MNKIIKKEKFLQIQNAEKVLEVQFEISNAVHSTKDLNALYKAIHKSLEKVLNVDNFLIASHNKIKDSISFPYHIDTVDTELAPEVFNFSKTGSLTGRVIKAGKPLIFFSKELTKLKKEDLRCKREPIGLASKVWLGAPLIVRGRTIGAVVVQNYSSEETFQKSDLDILDMVSQHIAFAIERKEADDAIREQKQVLEKILKLVPVGIALRENRIFKSVNNEFVKIFGYENKIDFKNKKADMIYASKQEYIKAGEIIASDFISNKKVDFEYNLMKKDKTIFPAHITINYTNPNDPLSWTVASVTDLTERDNIRKEMMQHEKLQGILEMAGAICHELNQPLHAILGYCELLMMDDVIAKNEVREILDTIIEQINRIDTITKKLLNITQYKTLKYAGKSKIFDIWNSSVEEGNG